MPKIFFKITCPGMPLVSLRIIQHAGKMHVYSKQEEPDNCDIWSSYGLSNVENP